MIKSIGIYTLIAILLSIPFVLINSSLGFIKGSTPQLTALIVTLIFSLGWVFLSYIMGKLGKKNFIIFVISYGLIVMIVYTLSIFVEEIFSSVLILPLIFLLSPLYGARFLMSYSNSIFLGIPILILLCLLSYLLGRNFTKKNSKTV